MTFQSLHIYMLGAFLVVLVNIPIVLVRDCSKSINQLFAIALGLFKAVQTIKN